MDLLATSYLVENSIRAYNVDPVACRNAGAEGKWTMTISGATIYIEVFNFNSSPDTYYLQICSPLFKMPNKNNEALYLDMLELGFDMYNCGLCKKGDWFYVLSLRPTKGLDQVELDWILNRVSFYSNDYYNKLSFKYKDSWPPPAPPMPTDGEKVTDS
jgi:hypothetical protein